MSRILAGSFVILMLVAGMTSGRAQDKTAEVPDFTGTWKSTVTSSPDSMLSALGQEVTITRQGTSLVVENWLGQKVWPLDGRQGRRVTTRSDGAIFVTLYDARWVQHALVVTSTTTSTNTGGGTYSDMDTLSIDQDGRLVVQSLRTPKRHSDFLSMGATMATYRKGP